MLEFKVKDQTLIRQDNFGVVSDSINYLTAEFDLTESEFSGTITAVFTSIISEKSYEQILNDSWCLVPWEVIKSRGFKVSLFCDLDNKRITTDCVTVAVKESGFKEGKTPQEPSSTVYEQLITTANSAESKAQKVLDMAERGDFQGEKGEKGDKGDTGTTNYTELEHKPSINGVELDGNISLTALKAQQALNGGRLKDIIVIRSLEEYDNLFGNEEYVANLTESLQDGEYILFCLLGAELDDGKIETMISTIVKENDELVFYDGFSTDAIREEIRKAVRPIEEELEAIKPKIDNKLDRAFELKHNCEHRRPEPYFFTSTWLQLLLPSAIPDDYISSLVFNSGNEPTILNYPQTILFTGDDVTDNVFVPKANTTYNVMFWYDGINVNAVSRGVPYAQE